MHTTAEFDTAFATFIVNCQQLVDEGREALVSSDPDFKVKIGFDVGKRYIRIFKAGTAPHDKSVFCFVDMQQGSTYGDVLKAASWKAPAKHSRGSIFSKAQGVGRYGALYLR